MAINNPLLNYQLQGAETGIVLAPFNDLVIAAGVPTLIDLTLLQQSLNVPAMQGIQIINKSGYAPVRALSRRTQQRIECPGFSTIWSPFFAPIPSIIELSCDVAVTVDVTLVNQPLPPSQWSVAGDSLLRTNQDTVAPERIARIPIDVYLTATSNILAVTAPNKWFCTRLRVDLSSDWVCSAGAFNFRVRDDVAGSVFLSGYQPARVGTVNAPIIFSDLSGFQVLSQVAGRSLRVEIDGTLTAGFLHVTAFYGLTQLPS